MNVNPVLLGFALGMCFLIIATLMYERRDQRASIPPLPKFVGDGGRAATPPAVPAPDQPAPVIPVSGAGTIDASGSAPAAPAGVTDPAEEQGVVAPQERGCGKDGCSSDTRTPIYTDRTDLGHGVTRVTNWYCEPDPRRDPLLSAKKFTVTYDDYTITYDVYKVKP